MKKLSLTLAALLIAAPGLALAQSALSANDPSLPAPSESIIESNDDAFMRNFAVSGFTSALDEIDAASSVAVVVVNDAEIDPLSSDDLNALKARLSANPRASAALDAEGRSIDDVVGFGSSGEGGSVTIYVNA